MPFLRTLWLGRRAVRSAAEGPCINSQVRAGELGAHPRIKSTGLCTLRESSNLLYRYTRVHGSKAENGMLLYVQAPCYDNAVQRQRNYGYIQDADVYKFGKTCSAAN